MCQPMQAQVVREVNLGTPDQDSGGKDLPGTPYRTLVSGLIFLSFQ